MKTIGKHRKTIGKSYENGGSMGFNGFYPLVMTDIAIEHWETGFNFSCPLVMTNIGKPYENGG